MVFNYGSDSYLLQGKKSNLTGKVKFRVAVPASFFETVCCQTLTDNLLADAGLWNDDHV